MLSQMCYAPNDGLHWAQERISGSAESNDFPTYAAFLRSEGEGSECGRSDGFQRSGERVYTVAADEKLHILHTERCCVGFGSSVFPGSQEEEEGEGNHIRGRLIGLAGYDVIGKGDCHDIV